MRLAAGLLLDPLGELERSRRLLSRNRGVLLIRGTEGDRREGKGRGSKGEERVYIYLTSGYGLAGAAAMRPLATSTVATC